ncbi:MAG: RagB/SusD family nutrient uptake outer membrane protein [Saprospiraceae bacterium]|nr:RagB/SusD family nutrient uptake outer membrane protein [Saprospiraceae bacterium]
MKEKYWIILLFSLSACSIDEDPKSLITSDEFFLEDRDAQASVDAIYQSINSGTSVYAEYYWLVNAMASDLGASDGLNPDISEFADFNLTAQNKIVESIWKDLYQGIRASNYAIQNLPNAPISENEKLGLAGEARFLRAFFYFDLVRFFGAIPLVRESALDFSEIVQIGRTPLDTIYQFLDREFTFAFENLPTNANPGRPSKYTAAAYLCKFLISTKNYSRAAQASRFIIQSGNFTLQNDYANLFKAHSQNNSEVLWSVNLNNNRGSNINLLTLPKGLGGRSRVLPRPDFYNDFDSLDRRRTVTFLTKYPDDQGNTQTVPPHIRKFWDQNTEKIPGNSGIDIPLIRYADILLLHAEALNELRNGTSTEALSVINTVRARARFDGTTVQPILPDLDRLDKASFAEAILQERKYELGWEGHRWFDLIRFGKLEEKVTVSKPGSMVSLTHHLFPIPASELTLNKLMSQNPGY